LELFCFDFQAKEILPEKDFKEKNTYSCKKKYNFKGIKSVINNLSFTGLLKKIK